MADTMTEATKIAVRRNLRSAIQHMDNAAADTRAAIYESDDVKDVLRRALAAENALQLALNDLTETMILANPESANG